jgi:NAD(P)-dependent dehydrogenase (short-subunit alcohol dehydrogenase family)
VSGLDGKVAIVTGAARGIGLGYAQRLAREGAMVALADLDTDLAEEEAARITDAGGKALGVSVDVSDEQATKRMAEQTAEVFGGIDILVNNAAIYAGYIHYLPQDLPLDYWQKFLDVNLTGVLLCCRAVLPFMRERGRGRIVNQSSAAADVPHNQYGITKLGVQGITISLARTLARDAITVNCIAPGITDTEATRGLYNDEQLAEMVATRQLVGRRGTPADLAAALLWLVGDESDFVTGQLIRVDGGYVMHPG